MPNVSLTATALACALALPVMAHAGGVPTIRGDVSKDKTAPQVCVKELADEAPAKPCTIPRADFERLCLAYYALSMEVLGVNPYETTEGARLLEGCPDPLA